jgi:hypothetical protein
VDFDDLQLNRNSEDRNVAGATLQCVFSKMSSFTENSLVKKLGDLNNTQQSIQTLSLWLIHHRKHAASIVQIWYKELCKGQ